MAPWASVLHVVTREIFSPISLHCDEISWLTFASFGCVSEVGRDFISALVRRGLALENLVVFRVEYLLSPIFVENF